MAELKFNFSYTHNMSALGYRLKKNGLIDSAIWLSPDASRELV